MVFNVGSATEGTLIVFCGAVFRCYPNMWSTVAQHAHTAKQTWPSPSLTISKNSVLAEHDNLLILVYNW